MEQERKDNKEIPDSRLHVCFFAHTYVITNQDSDIKEKEDWKKYEDDKTDPECEFSRFVNQKTHREYIWDGKEETILKTDNNKEIDLKMIKALKFLHSTAAIKGKFNIKNGGDYALILKAIKIQPNLDVMQRFSGYQGLLNYTYEQFVEYIKGLGFDDICGYRNLERYYKYIDGKWPDLTYSDCKYNKGKEEWKNRIIKVFIDVMKEENKPTPYPIF